MNQVKNAIKELRKHEKPIHEIKIQLFMDNHVDIANDNELAFVWGSLKIRDMLYEDIKTYQRKPIEQLDLGGYWDE